MAAYDAPFPHIDPVEIGINQMFDQMIFCLNQRREAVLTAYRDLKQDIAARPLTRARKEEELIGLRFETENRLQMNDLRGSQELILAVIEQKLAEVRAPQPDTRIVFRSESVPLEQLITDLGEVLEEEVPLVPNYLTMRPVVAVGKWGTAPGELYYPNAVTVDSNNRIFIAEGDVSESHARISVFSERGDFLTSFTHQDMREPYGLAIHGDYLYVTDSELHAIFHFKMEPQFSLVTKQGNGGSQIGEFNCPLNLTVSTNGDVYVADWRNNRVQILNSSLQHLRTLTEQLIRLPCDIKLTADEVYVLCDDNPRVHVLSYAGERLRSLVSRGYQIQVTSPECFCLDAAENIIISDCLASRIQIFSKEGNLINTLGERQQPRMYPTGLALTKELSLVVVSLNDNFTLQIFS